MNKEELLEKKEALFTKYAEIYRNYLYGNCSTYSIDDAIEEINSLVHDEVNLENLSDTSAGDLVEKIVRENLRRCKRIDKEVTEAYEKEIVEPLAAELLDLLQFKGLIKSVQFKQRAEELKEKLTKYDGVFMARYKALRDFFHSKRGEKCCEYSKIMLALTVGALDTKNI